LRQQPGVGVLAQADEIEVPGVLFHRTRHCHAVLQDRVAEVAGQYVSDGHQPEGRVEHEAGPWSRYHPEISVAM